MSKKRTTDAACVAKLTGSDKEFGNFLYGDVDLSLQTNGKTDALACRLLLSEIDGLPLRPSYGGPLTVSAAAAPGQYGGYRYSGYDYHGYEWVNTTHSYGAASNPQDSGRKYLRSNGGCFYIDLQHLECCTPETRSSREHEAAWGALLKTARHAQIEANARLPEGQRIVLLANNSDRNGNSYGGHQSFLMKRSTWSEMIERRMYPSLFFLMAHQVSSIVFTGQGKVGSENGAPQVDYQISQRADFIETLLGEQTTYYRPIVNTRNEPLCGSGRNTAGAGALPADLYARLHVIFYDTTLAPVATYLMVGVMQIVLALIEACRVDTRLLLDDPLAALHTWSHDPDLNARMPLVSGQRLTAVQLQLEFAKIARAAQDDGIFAGVVPDAEHILTLWEDTLQKLHARSFDCVRGRIDWLMKRALLEGALRDHPDWTWQSPEMVHLDQIYSSLDPDDSLFLAVESGGLIEAVSDESEIETYLTSPPESTRAWLRTMLLRAAGADRVLRVNWDEITCRPAKDDYRQLHIQMADPLGGTREAVEAVFLASQNFADLIARLQSIGAITLRAAGAARTSLARSTLDGQPTPPTLN